MPFHLLEPFDEHLVAARGLRVIRVDAEPAGDGVERAGVFHTFEVRQMVFSRPLPPDGFWRREARRVVDHGAATKCRALQHDQAQIARSEHAARIVHRFERVPLLVGEVRLVAIPALLQHDDVLPCGGQLSRDHATAGARADDDYVAAERTVRRNGDRTDRLRGGGRRTQRAGISDGARRSGCGVMRDSRQPLQRLKCLATLRHAARCPAAQAPLALRG